MLMAILPGRFSRAEIDRAWEYYLPYTTHDSSLSAGMHAVVAARLGKSDDAWRFWQQASAIDLNVIGGGAAEGVHIANAGAVWQMIVFGFAGMRSAIEVDALTLDPHLPIGWSRLCFPISFHGVRFEIVVTHDEIQVTNQGDTAGPVQVRGDCRIIEPGKNATWTNR
jgi:kojibiose phosphorylase